jgi:hypothetical protein
MKEISCEVREPEELEKMFLELTSILINECELVVGKEKYRIVECEIYYYDEAGSHKDPFAHKVVEQAEIGNWYFNGFGLDLTFGNGSKEEGKRIYGGILLRAIKRLDNSEYFNGPTILLKEIFSKLGSIHSKENSIYISEKTSDYDEKSKRIETDKRIGLKREKNKDYFNKKYRYMADILDNRELKNKTAAIITLHKKYDDITSDDVKKALGYTPKQCNDNRPRN